jgi:hypothetical protein
MRIEFTLVGEMSLPNHKAQKEGDKEAKELSPCPMSQVMKACQERKEVDVASNRGVGKKSKLISSPT